MTHLDYAEPEAPVIAGVKGDWEMVIGLEVHAQITSQAKLFSGASTAFGAEPNSNVSFVDAGMPGMLPVVNEYCIEQAVRTGLGLKAAINLNSAFDRKNYFYPDLPQGYQISQLYHPLVGEGEVIVDMGPGLARRVRIERIHLEQDAGKSIHDMDPAMSFVDLNRTGVALMEIVSRPDIRGPEEAAAYVTKLRQILRYLGTCDGNMQKGNLRADVNVSVCRPAEIGFRPSRHTLRDQEHELDALHPGRRSISRPAARSRSSKMAASVDQETRLYDPDKGETRSMRSKEEAHDYRYFPCPDLLPLRSNRPGSTTSRPACPNCRTKRRRASCASTGSPNTTRACSRPNARPPISSKTWRAGATARRRRTGSSTSCSAGSTRKTRDRRQPGLGGAAGRRLDLIAAGDISGKIAKDLFEIVWAEGGDPAAIVEARGMKQVTDTGAIEPSSTR
jgi:aspartyl-tRNA(Asn)/glutamyl-tRNA(Gln) amidotransferase subunit B